MATDDELAICQMRTIETVLPGGGMDFETALERLGLMAKKYEIIAKKEGMTWLADKINEGYNGRDKMKSIRMLKEGDIIELKEGHEIYADVPEHFVFTNRRGCYKLTHHNITIGGNFDYFQGTYIVYKTSLEGGGTGHGPGDIYPNGHRVFCEKKDNPEVKVDFYQSGAFTAMIKNIEPVGKAYRQWVAR